jgi:hypothetical protein
MAVMSISAFSVAANATSANVWAGNYNEFLSRPSLVRFGLVGSAAGLNTTIQIGSRIIVNDQPISGANRWPIDPDDFVIQAGGRPTERIVEVFRNTTAGALTVNAVVQISELA